MAQKPRKFDRATTRKLQELPGLFDGREIDMTDVFDSGSAGPANDAATPDADEQTDGLDNLELKPIVEDADERLLFMSMGSGSAGNSCYIGTRKSGILIDAGVHNHTIEKLLAQNGIDIDGIRDIFVTHEHGDHVKYVYALMRKHRHMRLRCTNRTLQGMYTRHGFTKRLSDYHEAIFKEYTYRAAGMEVTPFEVSHDADTVGYSIAFGDDPERRHVFVVCPDTGVITTRANEYLRQARYIMIESNYDLHMLVTGPYPDHLKARVLSDKGHMDNAVTASYLAKIYTPRLSHIFLAHLSEKNNTPALALATVRQALEGAGLTVGDADNSTASRQAQVQLAALPRFGASPLYVFRKSEFGDKA